MIIDGLNTTGANADTIQLDVASFSFLNANMSQAADLAAILAHASSGASGVTIADSHGDSLTLSGLTLPPLAVVWFAPDR